MSGQESIKIQRVDGEGEDAFFDLYINNKKIMSSVSIHQILSFLGKQSDDERNEIIDD